MLRLLLTSANPVTQELNGLRSILRRVRLDWRHRESLSESQTQVLTMSSFPRMLVAHVSAFDPSNFRQADGRVSGSAVAGQNNTFLPHKGVLSPSEKTLYISYSNGAGPVRLVK